MLDHVTYPPQHDPRISPIYALNEVDVKPPAAVVWRAPEFTEIITPAATLAIGSAETVALFRDGSAEPLANRTAILEFMVEDADAHFARLKDRSN